MFSFVLHSQNPLHNTVKKHIVTSDFPRLQRKLRSFDRQREKKKKYNVFILVNFFNNSFSPARGTSLFFFFVSKNRDVRYFPVPPDLLQISGGASHRGRKGKRTIALYVAPTFFYKSCDFFFRKVNKNLWFINA